MTAGQLTLGDCDPAWNNLLRPSRAPRRAPIQRRSRDLAGQPITYSRKHRIVDVPIVGNWL